MNLIDKIQKTPSNSNDEISMTVTLTEDAQNVYWFLSEWEFDVGLIGLNDLRERSRVFNWLMGTEQEFDRDPRGETERTNELSTGPTQSDDDESIEEADEAELPPLELIPIGLRHKWCFTKNDADFYPSVPHGHLENKTNPWPKLNPYTGRAFAAMHSEDIRFRLQKQEMLTLWNDAKFRHHALETIAWYREAYPLYKFPVANPQRLPRWRRR